MNWVATLALS